MTRTTCLAAAFPLFLFATAMPAQNLLLDGSFELGVVTVCDQGAVPDTWFQAQPFWPGADTYTVDCTTRPGLMINVYAHFTSVGGAQDGQRFAAGHSGINEAFGTTLTSPLVPGSVYQLSGWFTCASTTPGNAGYDVYLSTAGQRLSGTLVGVIGANVPVGSWAPASLQFTAPVGAANLILDPRPNTSTYTGVDHLLLMPVATSNGGFGLGGGIVGSAGLPQLIANGAPAAGQGLTLSLTHAPTNAIGLRVLGLVRVDTPLFGGVLAPRPDVIDVVITDAAGHHTSNLTWPTFSWPGMQVLAQVAVFDSAAPAGITASNGLLLR